MRSVAAMAIPIKHHSDLWFTGRLDLFAELLQTSAVNAFMAPLLRLAEKNWLSLKIMRGAQRDKTLRDAKQSLPRAAQKQARPTLDLPLLEISETKEETRHRNQKNCGRIGGFYGSGRAELS
jgi:hypothetical protein